MSCLVPGGGGGGGGGGRMGLKLLSEYLSFHVTPLSGRGLKLSWMLLVEAVKVVDECHYTLMEGISKQGPLVCDLT
ncbi:hypothetical protein NQZ68_002159 [Dissostichus eleginoides]|nr:hypothetical protein NQZ68_002159 [Dissostichus eleginoides]